VCLVEAKGAVEALKLCLGPLSSPAKCTLRATFPDYRFYSSTVDGWKIVVRLTKVPVENERTLMVVLPHVLSAGKTSAVFDEIKELGFQTIARKRTKLTVQAVRFIYGELADDSEFVAALTEGNVEAAVFEKLGAIEALHSCLGSPCMKDWKSHKHTLRAKFGVDSVRCACLSSKDMESAIREISYFFPNIVAPTDMEEFLQASGATKLLQEVIMNGLKELSTAKPTDPIQWFGRWLLSQYKTDKIVK